MPGDEQLAAEDVTRRERRFTLAACAIGMAAAYATLLPLKWHGLMPDHFGWLDVIAAPPLTIGWIGFMVVGSLTFPRHTYLIWFVSSAAVIVVLLLLMARRWWPPE